MVAIESTSDGIGVAEQQAPGWLRALRETLAKVDPDIRQNAASVAVSGQQHGFVAVDAAHEMLAPVKLWCDTSTATECLEIMDTCGGRDTCNEKFGNPILPGYTASKARWFKKEHPEVF